MDTLFDGEHELDEMKFKKERHFRCVCVCSICGQLNLWFTDSFPSPNLVLISFVVFFCLKNAPILIPVSICTSVFLYVSRFLTKVRLWFLLAVNLFYPPPPLVVLTWFNVCCWGGQSLLCKVRHR